jgi:hypothetical protein
MKYAVEVAIAVGELLEKPPKPIEHKLLDTVAKRLKLDEAQEAKMEAQSDEDLEKELARLNKQEKETKTGKKAKKNEDDEGGEE